MSKTLSKADDERLEAFIIDEVLSSAKRQSHPALADAISWMLINEPAKLFWWGEFVARFTYRETDKIPNIGVSVTPGGVVCLYNKDWLESEAASMGAKVNPKIGYMLMHESLKIMWKYLSRVGMREPGISKIAMDALINGTIDKISAIEPPIKPYLSMPVEYEGEFSFELFFAWCSKRSAWLKINPQPRRDEPGYRKQHINGQPVQRMVKGKMTDIRSDELITLDDALQHEENDEPGQTPGTWSTELPDASGVDPADAEKIVDDIKKEATAKSESRGHKTSDETDMIGKIKKTRTDFTREIRTAASNMLGSETESTWKRPSRTGIFGIKGYKRVGKEVNALLDTSGSMGGDFHTALSPVFRDGLSVNVVLCDTEVKGSVKCKNKHEVQKIAIKGLGGTELQPGINYAISKMNKRLPLFILTDGYCDSLDTSKYPGKVLVLSTRVLPKISKSNGRTKVMHIDRHATDNV